MLWTALQEKEKAEELLEEERNLSREYAKEVSQWAEMAQKLAQENLALKQAKERGDRRTADMLEKMRHHGLYYQTASAADNE